MPRKSQFTDEQIIRAIREVDGGSKIPDLARRLGVTEKTFYRWRQKFGGMEVNEAKRLRALEDENARLKKLLAEQLLDNEALRMVVAKNGDARDPPPGRGLPAEGVEDERAACVPRGRRVARELSLHIDEEGPTRARREAARAREAAATVWLPRSPSLAASTRSLQASRRHHRRQRP